MSTIEQPPFERQPVETYVLEYDDGILEQAIRRELARGGQVYYLYNRVETIDNCAARVAKLAPGARIATAHGKMTEQQLSSVWQALLDGEIDILICTTIIETGVDVRNCNTLIIEDADRMVAAAGQKHARHPRKAAGTGPAARLDRHGAEQPCGRCGRSGAAAGDRKTVPCKAGPRRAGKGAGRPCAARVFAPPCTRGAGRLHTKRSGARPRHTV